MSSRRFCCCAKRSNSWFPSIDDIHRVLAMKNQKRSLWLALVCRSFIFNHQSGVTAHVLKSLYIYIYIRIYSFFKHVCAHNAVYFRKSGVAAPISQKKAVCPLMFCRNVHASTFAKTCRCVKIKKKKAKKQYFVVNRSTYQKTYVLNLFLLNSTYPT